MAHPESRPVPPQHSAQPHQPTIAELVSHACTLLTLPGVLLYFMAILAVMLKFIQLNGNLLLAMLLALSGFGLFLVAVIGGTASLMEYWRTGTLSRFTTTGLYVQGGIVIGMLVLWCSGWQIEA